ncbi:MAG: nucleotidyltransferase domain-containing protein [Elusimicrobiota bacterium]
MDIKQIKLTINNWVKSHDIKCRVYLFGSQARRTAKENSDYDIALEFLDTFTEIEHTLLWIDNHSIWENELSELFKANVDLQLYAGDEYPTIKKGLEEKNILLFT